MSGGEIMSTTDIDEQTVDGTPDTALDGAESRIDYSPASSDAVTPLTRPRVRWAGIVWGLVLAAIAATALWVLADAERVDAVRQWFMGLTPAAVAAYVALTVGALALVAGLVGIARRVQRGLESRRQAGSARPEAPGDAPAAPGGGVGTITAPD